MGAGYPFDCLDDAPACPLCGGQRLPPGRQPLPLPHEVLYPEQNRRLSKLLDLGNQSFDTFSFDWYSAEVWPQYGRSPLENMEAIREICGNYAHTFGSRSGNLLFTGAPGLGKTFLSACIAREVSDHGFSVVYDTAAHVFQQFESGKFGRDNPYEEDPDREINRYLNCDLLLMDDLGTEMLTSFVQSAFYRIVNDRLVKPAQDGPLHQPDHGGAGPALRRGPSAPGWRGSISPSSSSGRTSASSAGTGSETIESRRGRSIGPPPPAARRVFCMAAAGRVRSPGGPPGPA